LLVMKINKNVIRYQIAAESRIMAELVSLFLYKVFFQIRRG